MSAPPPAGAERAHWKSRAGFVLAAAGSAVGLGNVWKFPYVTGENGGGLFVVVYLASVALVGLPIMIAEVLIGRAAQVSPVGAFRKLSAPGSPWIGVGWLGVLAGFVILSYYSVVAGWALHYTWLSVSGQLGALGVEGVEGLFAELLGSPSLNLFWHVAFMGMTIGVVAFGVRSGIERGARILLPAMFFMMIVLAVYAATLDGFAQGIDFVFGFRADKLSAAGVLEALGQSFFTLSLGMGAMLTYGSYLSKKDDLVGASISIAALDTSVALLASVILFPITFTYGMEPAGGPGLVFKNIPLALIQLPFGSVLATVFFALLVFAALTSAISLLEVAAAYFIDEWGWSRKRAVWVTGGIITALGVPSALSGASAFFGADMERLVGRNWFDLFDFIASNWMLPIGGLGIALFMAWRVGERVRHEEFFSGTRWGALYRGWLILLRYLVPLAVVAVFLQAIGVF